jgi:aliphatic sulfonates family ABC transporter substrate-binding protein
MPTLELSRPDAPEARARAFVFDDPLSLALLRRIGQVAPTDATVLVTGETGTGKELVARHVHDRSRRSAARFVAVNCGALTPSLIESELFGHEKGAFTGALASKPGWFEDAHGGTLFLDEIGDLPLAAQVKLLRVLQEREVVRVGARRAIPIDVRLVAATNADLEQAVAEGRFREDLYYRLHVAHVAIAPLRDRPGDVIPLARHFLAVHAAGAGVASPAVADEALAALRGHRWPGNIRELENTMHRALVAAGSGPVRAEHLGLTRREPTTIAPSARAPEPTANPRAALRSALMVLFEEDTENLHEIIEETVFRAAYEHSEHNQLRTARLLGISRNVVRARLLHHGVLASVAPRSADQPIGIPRSAAPTRLARVRIGHQPFGVLSLLKAMHALNDALAAHGASVEWVEHPAGMQVIDALASGALDLGVVGEAPPVFAQAASAPVVYLAAEPPAPEGEAIVVLDGSPVRTLADLRGKSIAMTRGANVVYFVVRALEEVGLSLGDVDVRTLAPEQARTAFAHGDVDAWAIWNPLLASLQQALPTRVLRDARGLASNRAFYVGRRAFADAHPEIVGAFLGQVGAVGRWANERRGEAARMLAPHVKLPEAAVEAALARTPFDTQPIGREAMDSQQRIADTFHRLNLIVRPVHVEDAVWTPPWLTRRSA